MFKPSRLSLAVAVSLAPGASWAVGDDQPQMLEPMEIIGDASAAQTLPGSGYVVGDQQLKTEVEADINQVLKTVPGVYVREEGVWACALTLAFAVPRPSEAAMLP